MSKPSLIFLPDISGFTRFVNDTEVTHSQHIVAELLEVLIDANHLGFKLAEIEGDALFYYMQDRVPNRDEFLSQVEKMYVLFHEHLKQYEHRRVCQCGACSMAVNLKLKFIAHTGQIEFIQLKGDEKPYGKEIIWAHRLMKNDVPLDEYLLISEEAEETFPKQVNKPHHIQNEALSGKRLDKDMGELAYNYYSLKELQEYVGTVPPLPKGYLSARPLVFERVINRPVEEVYELITNLEERTAWNKSIDKLKYDPTQMNRMGTKHTCVVKGQQLKFETVTHDFGEGKWVYGEKTGSIPFVKEITNYFILEPEDGQTRLRLELHPKPWPVIGPVIKPIVKKFLARNLGTLVDDIKKVAEEQESNIN